MNIPDRLSISDDDKQKITRAFQAKDLVQLASISLFSQQHIPRHTTDDGFVYITANNVYLLYVCGSQHPVFFDEDRRILFGGRSIFQHNYCIQAILDFLAQIVSETKYINIHNSAIHHEGVHALAVDHWVNTYGHFLDEMFTLRYFYDTVPCPPTSPPTPL